ncbi:accessory Sec system glycosyltransferase Asp1, partial [Staphylococcus aureus]|uniref:accessory Sec system glycosyltransferase Asp1 n=1 Tax=Staphylococcus aureus TaxID=1280 RepID=UPI0011A536B4
SQHTTLPYYQLQNNTQFHHIITLIPIHLQNHLHYQLILLNHPPNLTTFLHPYHLYHTNYSSLFHQIQPFTHHPPQPINYHHLKSPHHLHF